MSPYKDFKRRFKTHGTHRALRNDIFDTIKDSDCHVIYFDLPYGSNNQKMPPSCVRYAAYYHIWTTIVQHDKPAVFVKVNRREDSRDLIAGSVFENSGQQANQHPS